MNLGKNIRNRHQKACKCLIFSLKLLLNAPIFSEKCPKFSLRTSKYSAPANFNSGKILVHLKNIYHWCRVATKLVLSRKCEFILVDPFTGPHMYKVRLLKDKSLWVLWLNIYLDGVHMKYHFRFNQDIFIVT